MEQLKALEILKKQKNQLELLQSGDWNEFEDDIRELNEAIAELEAPKSCEWSMDDPEWGTYKTECGQFYNIMGGDLKDNSFKYCTYCGGVIDEPKDTL